MFIGGPAAAPEPLDVKMEDADASRKKEEEEEEATEVDGVERTNALEKTERHVPARPTLAEIEERIGRGEVEDGLLGDVGFWRELEGWVEGRFKGDRERAEEVFGAFWRGWVDRARM